MAVWTGLKSERLFGSTGSQHLRDHMRRNLRESARFGALRIERSDKKDNADEVQFSFGRRDLARNGIVGRRSNQLRFRIGDNVRLRIRHDVRHGLRKRLRDLRDDADERSREERGFEMA